MIYPAAVTPFTRDGAVDLMQVTKLMAWFQDAGCDGVVLAGTTGEGPSLSAPEKRDLLFHVANHAQGLSVILGIATNSLTEAIWLCKQAGIATAEAVLLMPPSFFAEGGEESVEAWFLAIMDASEVPVLAYNFPKRTGVALSPELLARLSMHANFLGLKDSSGLSSNLKAYKQAAPASRLLVGDETLLPKALGEGWSGSVSGAGNVIGKWLKIFDTEYHRNKSSALEKFRLLAPALKALRSAPQPYTDKEILHRAGVLGEPLLRLPLLMRQKRETEAAAAACNSLLKLF